MTTSPVRLSAFVISVSVTFWPAAAVADGPRVKLLEDIWAGTASSNPGFAQLAAGCP